MNPREQIVLTPATGVAGKTQKLLSDLYSPTNDWIKNNTNADIEYLTRVVVATPANTRASDELNITLPSTTSELSLLTDYPIDPTEDTKIVNNTSIDRATK